MTMMISQPVTGPVRFRGLHSPVGFSGRFSQTGADRLSLGANRAEEAKPQPSRLARLLRGTALGLMLAATAAASPAATAQTAQASSVSENAVMSVDTSDPSAESVSNTTEAAENQMEAPMLLYQGNVSFAKKMTPDNKARLEAPIYVLNELGYGNITQIVVDPRCMFDPEKSEWPWEIHWDPTTNVITYPYMKDEAGIEACVDMVLESKVNADKLKAVMAQQDFIVVTTLLPSTGGSTWHPASYILLSDEMKRQIPNWEEVLKEVNIMGYADPTKPHATEPDHEGFKQAGFGNSAGPFEAAISNLFVRDKLGPMFQLLAQAQGKDLPLVTSDLVKEMTGVGYP